MAEFFLRDSSPEGLSAAANAKAVQRLFSPRKIVHISMLSFAFLLPYLSWMEAAGCAVLALLFNLYILPRLNVDLRKRGIEASSGNPWTGIALYPVSVLILIVLYRQSMHVVGAAWAIMALGDGMASVVGEAVRGPRLPHNSEKTWAGFISFVIAGTAGAYALMRWINPAITPAGALWMCGAAALSGAVVESLPIELDDNLTVPLVCGGLLFCLSFVDRVALAGNLPYLQGRVLFALGVNGILALLALTFRFVTLSGAAVGWVVGVAVYLGYGYKSFLILLAFFLLGSLATRLGYRKKAARGVAERRGGARSWREALANSLAGAFFAMVAAATPLESAFLLAMIAAFAEAAGDTVSSELGQWLSDRAYLISTLEPVPAGENGGITLAGTAAGVIASGLVVGVGYGVGLCERQGAIIALAAATLGNLADSLLGASVERRGLVTNGIVNFASTSFAGGLALVSALSMLD